MLDYRGILIRLVKGVIFTFIMALVFFFILRLFSPSISDPVTEKEHQISLLVGIGLWIIAGFIGFVTAFRGFKNLNK